ncbi:type VI secretion protein IcmF/TssM N-terminal domain-containing protein [Coxiella endosymbiont of Ornithodoros maritimus]|uniref:type VI secretion protein IcmF/TssM N-terminal domain-containing protein n=1 Tax=Coxiella endosymbiont of Ornithodoros maritimus TaxID=1656172 RepID=UPI00389901EE
MLKRKRRKSLFNAIILTINYLTLSKASGELDALADNIAPQLQTLLALGSIPLIVVITQCDRLDGFIHFF